MKKPSDQKDGGEKTFTQLSLLDLAGPLLPSPVLDEDEFVSRLETLAREPVRIVLTGNSHSLISARSGRDGVREVRVQHGFRGADERTLKALARFIVKPDRGSRMVVDEFIRRNQRLFEAMSRERTANGTPLGKHRDLKRALDKVMRDHGMKVDKVSICWGRAGKRLGGSIKFGSYSNGARAITIHPALDAPDVPDYFVEYIVYHELLHAVFPPVRGGNGKRGVHTREFKRFEKKFSRYDEARRFEKLFVEKMLR